MSKELRGVLVKRAKLTGRVIKTLNHLPHEQAMAIVMSWMSVDRLQDILDVNGPKEGGS